MKQIFKSPFIPTALIVLSACGPSKKLQQATAEISQLKETNAQQVQKIGDYEKDLNRMKEENIKYSREAQDCRELKEAISKNLEEMNNALAEQGTSLRKIKQKVDSSLESFYDAGVDVTYKNGLVHISMSDELVFTSGSTKIGWEGNEVLKVIAEELNKYPKVLVYVVGNTDDIPVKSGNRDNWTISTERANAIVRLLRDKYGVDPARLVAAGRGRHNPIGDNSTPEGRAMNRRTDIVVNPNLSRIWSN